MGFPTEPSVVGDSELKRIKTDRRFLELALEEAGRGLCSAPRISDDACHCPFHHDEHRSGSLYKDRKTGDWLFKCHACGGFGGGGGWNDLNPGKLRDFGDPIALLQVARKRAGQENDFQTACRWLLNSHAQHYPTPAFSIPPAPLPPVPAIPDPQFCARAEEEAGEAHQTLMNDPKLLKRLWNERAVDEHTARRFRVGYFEDCFGREWWIFPITDDDGTFMAQKRHAADGKTPKCRWDPKNAKIGQPVYPVDLSGNGLVCLCSGEFKAMAVVSLGLAALSSTAGETAKELPVKAVEMLRGRAVAIVPDNDDTGRAWASAVRDQLLQTGSDVRIVDPGLTTNHEDIGDWIVERRVNQGLDATTVVQQLVDAFERTPAATKTPSDVTPDSPTTTHSNAQPVACASIPIRPIGEVWCDEDVWKPVERIATHIRALDKVLRGGYVTGGVHLVGGKAGQCKTQLVLQIAVNAARHGVPVGFVSLEMGRDEVGRLVLAQLSEVPRTTIDNGLTKLHDKLAAQHVKQAIRTFSDLPLDIIDGADVSCGFTSEHLRAVVADGVTNRGWKLVVLDHLGELAPLDPTAQPLQIDKANAATMRAVARSNDVALVAVVPLRKAASFKDAKKDAFHLDDVMGSAAIGYAVRTCVVVSATYRKPPADSKVLIHFLKNRNGPLPEKPLQLCWLARCGRITDAGTELGGP